MCDNLTIDVYYPMKDLKFNKTECEEYQKLGIDLFNPNDKFFNEGLLCIAFSNNSTEIDVRVNSLRLINE